MLKACENSYDGRGNFLIASRDQVPKAFNYFSKNEIMVGKFVPFIKEISIMVARNPNWRDSIFSRCRKHA